MPVGAGVGLGVAAGGLEVAAVGAADGVAPRVCAEVGVGVADGVPRLDGVAGGGVAGAAGWEVALTAGCPVWAVCAAWSGRTSR